MNNIEKLRVALLKSLVIPESALNEELAYQSVPEWDSMAHMYLVSELEHTFGISIATEDILEMTDLAGIQQTLGKYNIGFEQEAPL